MKKIGKALLAFSAMLAAWYMLANAAFLLGTASSMYCLSRECERQYSIAGYIAAGIAVALLVSATATVQWWKSHREGAISLIVGGAVLAYLFGSFVVYWDPM